MTLVRSVGGASGPLYGTFFLRMAHRAGRRRRASTPRASPRRCAPVSTAWCSAATPRRATRRCSTRWRLPWTRLTPRWHQAPDLGGALCRTPPSPPKRAGTQQKPMVARKGRASYLGQRSVGHHRPGRDVGGDADRCGRNRVRPGPGDARVPPSASSSSRTAGRWPAPRSRWPRKWCTASEIRIAIAAGLDDTTFGTDAAQIVDAITAADQGAGVVVLMDLGSAVLSAELALELLDDDVRDRVVLCPAPLVEGLVVAAVAAAGGAGIDEVAAEAAGALAGKIGHLGARRRCRPRRAITRRRRRADRQLHRHQPPRSARPARPPGWSRRCGGATPARSSATAAPVRNGLTPAAFRRSPRWVCGTATRSRCGCRAARPPRHSSTSSRWPRDTSTSRRTDRPRRRPRGRADERHPIGAGSRARHRTGPLGAARLRSTCPTCPAEDPAAEWRRLGKAIAAVRRTISQLRTRTAREVGEAEAAIFDAHQLLLDDTALLDDVRARIDNGASGAVGLVGRGARRWPPSSPRCPTPT